MNWWENVGFQRSLQGGGQPPVQHWGCPAEALATRHQRREFPRIPANSREFPRIPANSRERFLSPLLVGGPRITANSREFPRIPANSREFPRMGVGRGMEGEGWRGMGGGGGGWGEVWCKEFFCFSVMKHGCGVIFFDELWQSMVEKVEIMHNWCQNWCQAL